MEYLRYYRFEYSGKERSVLSYWEDGMYLTGFDVKGVSVDEVNTLTEIIHSTARGMSRESLTDEEKQRKWYEALGTFKTRFRKFNKGMISNLKDMSINRRK